jgi:hypothetical protein
MRAEIADGVLPCDDYISQTASNTAGIRGTGTAYAQQVDFGFGLDKLGIWPTPSRAAP